MFVFILSLYACLNRIPKRRNGGTTTTLFDRMRERGKSVIRGGECDGMITQEEKRKKMSFRDARRERERGERERYDDADDVTRILSQQTLLFPSPCSFSPPLRPSKDIYRSRMRQTGSDSCLFFKFLLSLSLLYIFFCSLLPSPLFRLKYVLRIIYTAVCSTI